ncbi:MAG: septum formation initiator [Alphaproteobacteria bacterium CG_4_10_14_0_8_um_filter_37_21]|nr:MAG: septum formation initiator [Alphaproteobacteria bacterium CG_4_10_14_0_8_um_filter_37_21]
MHNTKDQFPDTKTIKKIWGPLAAIFLSFYFSYHIFQGERGVISWFQLSKKVKIDEEQLATLTAEKETLEQRVKLLRPDSIDLDMLEEQARRLLNYSKKDEITIHNNAIFPKKSQQASEAF